MQVNKIIEMKHRPRFPEKITSERPRENGLRP